MYNVYLMYDSGVTEKEASAIIAGIEEIESVFPGRLFVNYGSRPWSAGDYSSADWYLEHAPITTRNGEIQLLSDGILQLLNNEPWQKSDPHIDVFFVSQDLTTRTSQGQILNFVFGEAMGRATVQSVARFRWLDSNSKYLAIKALVQHELGHIFHLAGDRERGNTEYNLGMHCTNPGCVMRQALTVEDWVKNAIESQRRRMIYCPQCLEDAQRTNI